PTSQAGVRRAFFWLVHPLWLLVRMSGVPPMALTTLSAALAVGAGIGIAAGRFGLGGLLYLAAGLCDVFDGRLARERGTAGPPGALLDSVTDRYSDGAVLVGVAWALRDSAWALAALIALLGTLIVPYVRARSEGLGIQG